jgi:outer membrane protein
MTHRLQVHLPVLGLAVCALFSVFAAAQGGSASSGAPAGNKIGTVGIQDVIVNTNEGKKEMDVLQRRFAPKSSALKAQSDEIEKVTSQLQAQGDKLTEDERAKRVKEISQKQKALERASEDMQSEVQQAEQEVMSRLGSKLLRVLEIYADKNGYAVILDVSSPQTPVLWSRPGTNISKELVDAYNAENPVSSRSAAAPSATTPKKP